MRITVLNDNIAGRGFGAEHGLSFLVEERKRILFDAGHSDMFLSNARALGIDLAGVDLAVLSHGHWDHGNGFAHIGGMPLICHPGCFTRRYTKRKRRYIGLSFTRASAEERFQLRTSRDPVKLTDGITFLGEIPRTIKFDAVETPFCTEDGGEDNVPDDSALAVETKVGLIIVTGCSHSGICNIVEHAMSVTGQRRVHAVLGGLHLLDAGDRTVRTIEFLRELEVERIHPSHCTSFPAQVRFHEAFGSEPLRSGDVLEFPD